MKKIGLMGCGLVATYGHLPAIRETPGLIVSSVYDPNPTQLARFCEQFPGIAGFTDSDAFFRSDIEAVAVTSPAPAHVANVRKASQYGKHVLCEKPLAMRDDEIIEMIDVMEKAGLMLSTAFCYRFSPVALKIRELIESGVIGHARALRLIYVWDLHGKYETTESGARILSPRRIGRMVEGGPMVDCGAHQIDLARFWIDSEIVGHRAHGAWVDDDAFEAPDHMWLHLDHANGAHTAIEISFSYTHTAAEPIDEFQYQIVGSDGLIRYDRHNWQFEVRNSQGTFYLPGASEKNFTGMYHAWRDALESGNPGNLPTGRDGLLVTRIARSATDEVIAARQMLTALGTKA